MTILIVVGNPGGLILIELVEEKGGLGAEAAIDSATARVDKTSVFVTLLVEEDEPRPIPSRPRVGLSAQHRVWGSCLV